MPRESDRERRSRPRPRYIPALDGIRALSVIAVVLYHLNVTWMQGGAAGVTVFFVLSGFLITRLLLAEFEGTGRIDLKRFWTRRVRRLVPAIVTVVVVTALLCTLFNHVMLTKMRPDILPSLLFFNNWWQIAHNVSYFDALGDPSPLTHFWSLAIEEQFYVVWPVALLVALRHGAKRKGVRRGVLVAAAASALAMTLLYDPSLDPSRVYYGTDTRVFSLLLGAWLACVPEGSLSIRGLRCWFERIRHAIMRGRGTKDSAQNPTNEQTASHRDERQRDAQHTGASIRAFDLIGVAALLGLCAIAVLTNGYGSFPYRGGTLLCTLLALALIAACSQPGSLLARALSTKPLTWLGTRSYGIYLWHYPLLNLMNTTRDITAKPWWAYVVQIGIVLLVAEASYRFIEEPFRRGAVGIALRRIRSGATTPAKLARKRLIPLAAAGAVTLIAIGGILFVPDTSALSTEGAALLQQDGDGAKSGDGDATDAKAPANESSYDIVMIGDSVSVRAVPAFEREFPHGHIDAAKNRQFSAGTDIYRALIDQKLAGSVLVFALGTNGPVSDADVDALMQLAGDERTVAFVTTRSPQPWVGPVNDTLKRAAERYGNVRIVDWYAYSEGRNDLFDGDGTHLNDAGAEAYVGLVHDAVRDVLPVRLEDEGVRDAYRDQATAGAERIAEAARSAAADAFGKKEPAES